jgi:hypothetical protein
MSRFPFVLLAVATVAGCGSSVTIDTTAAGDGGSSITIGGACVKAGALDCNGVGQRVELLCDGAHWTNGGICAGAQLCDPRSGPTKGSCQTAIQACAANGSGYSYCDGAVRKTCNADLVSTADEKCASAALCNAAGGPHCPACANGDHVCKGADLYACSKGELVKEKSCADAASCNAIAGVCAPIICTPGDYRCDGATLAKCDASGTTWNGVSLCGGDCNAAAHRCDPCMTGAAQCLGNVPRVCDASGAWQQGPACSAGCMDGVCL